MLIGELAKATGIAPSALRYYEQQGLLEAKGRTEGGFRVYELAALGRLQFIQRAQALGLSVREIRQLIGVPRVETAEERRALKHLVAHKLAETSARVAKLEQLRDELRALYVRLDRAPGPQCGHIGDCACWLPTEKEVTTMEQEVESTEDCTCCGCSEPGCDCGCTCCGPES